METKNAPTKDWAQRTDAGLALLPLPAPYCSSSSEPPLLLPESRPSRPSQASRHGNSGSHSLAFKLSAPSLPKKSETLLLE